MLEKYHPGATSGEEGRDGKLPSLGSNAYFQPGKLVFRPLGAAIHQLFIVEGNLQTSDITPDRQKSVMEEIVTVMNNILNIARNELRKRGAEIDMDWEGLNPKEKISIIDHLRREFKQVLHERKAALDEPSVATYVSPGRRSRLDR